MHTVKISELKLHELNWAIAVHCLEYDKMQMQFVDDGDGNYAVISADDDLVVTRHQYAIIDDRVSGGLVDQYGVCISLRYAGQAPNWVHDIWDAIIKPEYYSSGRPNTGIKHEIIASGPTRLVAAMRCILRAKMSVVHGIGCDSVDVPDDLV